jgi:hypothetical protein
MAYYPLSLLLLTQTRTNVQHTHTQINKHTLHATYQTKKTEEKVEIKGDEMGENNNNFIPPISHHYKHFIHSKYHTEKIFYTN